MEQTKRTNKKAIVYGAAAGVLLPLFVWEPIQGIIALAAGASQLAFKMSSIKLCAYFEWDRGEILGSIVYLIPYLLTLGFIAGAFRAQKRTKSVFARHFLLVFLLILSGYAFIDVFYGAFSIILDFNHDNDWARMTALMQLTKTEGMIFIFTIILITAGYLNFLLKRILHYINI